MFPLPTQSEHNWVSAECLLKSKGALDITLLCSNQRIEIDGYLRVKPVEANKGAQVDAITGSTCPRTCHILYQRHASLSTEKC